MYYLVSFHHESSVCLFLRSKLFFGCVCENGKKFGHRTASRFFSYEEEMRRRMAFIDNDDHDENLFSRKNGFFSSEMPFFVENISWLVVRCILSLKIQ